MMHASTADATILPMKRENAIFLTTSATKTTIKKPGARYVVRRVGREHGGFWLPDGDGMPPGYADAFTEAEARLLLPFLRARGAAGRAPSKATTADGRLINKAMKVLKLNAALLAELLGVHESTISRARHGTLTDELREEIRSYIRSHSR